MGILAANIVAFGQPFQAYMYPDAFLTGHDDSSNWMWIVQFILVDGKMRGLFTLLFGAGMYLFLERAWARGSGIPLQARRLGWLLLFGLVHFFLIWRGDILVLYALSGFAALLFVKLKAKTQMHLGILGYIAGGLVYALLFGPLYFVAETPLGKNVAFVELAETLGEAKALEIADGVSEAAIIQNGSWFDFVGHNFAVHGLDPFSMIFVFAFETVPLILLGMALYRMGLFSGGFAPGRQRMWGWLGVIGGTLVTIPIALWGASTGPSYWGSLAALTAFSFLPRLPVVVGLAALLALWGAHANGWLGRRIKAAGRAAFTNYLGTSILMLFVFHGWAGGLYGELNRPQLYIVVASTWVLMLLWSKPWLDRFRFGPLEWLWRCLTYGERFPLKR
ncbi:MAG: DUF418 domain-containing protein [Sphingomonadaceae bacterium]|nr:DUF418 domain-containing protein [Sphingomonadaceae bacterium]